MTVFFDPRLAFPHFYTNEIITKVLGPMPIWTVSNPTSKMPIYWMVATGVPTPSLFVVHGHAMSECSSLSMS